MQYVIALIIICGLIIFHEFGHFLAARACGITVEEFAVGMGPKLISRKSGKTGTVYSLRLFPIGGFCALKGENEEGGGSDSFNGASIWRRLSVVLAGPMFNILLALVLSVVYITFSGFDTASVVSIDDTAKEAGLMKGDVIVEYDGHHILSSYDLQIRQSFYRDDDADIVSLKVDRDGTIVPVTFAAVDASRYYIGLNWTAELDENDEETGNVLVCGILPGSELEKYPISAGDVIRSINGDQNAVEFMKNADIGAEDTFDFVYVHDGRQSVIDGCHPYYMHRTEDGFHYNLKNLPSDHVFADACKELQFQVKTVYMSIAGLVTGRFSLKDMTGVVGMVKTIGDSYSATTSETLSASTSMQTDKLSAWANLLSLIIMISVNLGILNLLPIPALDGGHVLFYLIELIRGKKVHIQVEQMAMRYSMMLLLVLSAVLVIKDFWVLLFK